MSTMALLALNGSPVRQRTGHNRDLAHLSDEALVALIARGDEGALAELYDRFGAVAFGLALRVVRDAALAEDAVQEAFLTVWRTASRFVAERGKARTWILTLVHRRAVDVVRREQTRRTDPLKEQPESGGRTAEEEAWLRLERTRVQEALKRLPDQQREAIELAYYGGFTNPSPPTASASPWTLSRAVMFTGLSRLRELLEETGHEEEKWNAPEFTS